MADDLCQCPKCGRMHRDLGFGKPPLTVAEIKAADAAELGRLRADNLRLVEIVARNEEHYQAAMAMSEKHRRLWVEACQEREKIRAALQGFMKISARPWMDGGVSWPEWDAAYSAAEATMTAAERIPVPDDTSPEAA